MPSEEIWKDIPTYEGLYQISTLGRIQSLPRWVIEPGGRSRFLRGRSMKPHVEKRGYQRIKLSKNGKITRYRIQRLVLLTFIGRPSTGEESCHKDGQSSNNTLDNLYWGTHKKNIADKIDHGTAQRGEKHGCAKLTDEAVRAIRTDGRKQRDIAKSYGVSQSQIWGILHRKHWAHVE